MSPLKPREPFILQDRVLLGALCFGSSGYIVLGSWPGIALMVTSFILASVWAFRTAGSHPEKRMRLMATLLLVTLGVFMTVYVAAHQGLLSKVS
jgi:hypothetical protein